jgi:hypothetical protein
MGLNNNNPRRGGSLLVACTAAIGTLPPEVYGASDEAKRVETRPVPPPFLGLPLTDVLPPSRTLACDAQS